MSEMEEMSGMEMTRAGGQRNTSSMDGMEMTCAGGQKNTSAMDMTLGPMRSIVKEFERELPGSGGSSGNSSFDGGATATMPFSGLALANNTLLLPRKESEEEEEDMTKVPIQIINYDPLRP